MDEMKITSTFTTKLISNVLQTVLRKKLGYNVGIQLNEVKASVTDGKTHIHLDVDAELSKEELMKILANAGF